MNCKICNVKTKKVFSTTILNKYNDIKYYYCSNCHFLQTEEPFWLHESYTDVITQQDTGLVSRNVSLSRTVSVLLFFLFDKKATFLDYGGGYGMFTRLMRDMGFDFYWHDPYCQNILAKGFEHTDKIRTFQLVTAFECFEHFANPIEDIEKILTYSSNVIFTTNLLPSPVPQPTEWWYYAVNTGQHISFYSPKTLEFIAKKYGLFLYSWGGIHLLTKNKIKRFIFNRIMKYREKFLFSYVKKRMKSLTVYDMHVIKNKAQRL